MIQSDAKLRTLSLYADDQEVCSDCLIRVHGAATMDVFPNCWQVDVWYPSQSDLALMRYAEMITVRGMGDTEIVSFRAAEIIDHDSEEGQCISIYAYDGDEFWRSYVSMSIPAGASAIQSMIALVQSCSSNIPIMDVPTRINGTCERRQTYFCRTADALDDMCHTYGTRAYTRPDGLYIVSPNQGIVDAELDDEAVLEYSDASEKGIIVIRTDVIGRRIGSMILLNTSQHGGTYRIVAIDVNADNGTGPWDYILTLADETALTAESLDGWEGCK